MKPLKFKVWIAIVLAAAMILCLGPFTSMAEQDADTGQTIEEPAVQQEEAMAEEPADAGADYSAAEEPAADGQQAESAEPENDDMTENVPEDGTASGFAEIEEGADVIPDLPGDESPAEAESQEEVTEDTADEVIETETPAGVAGTLTYNDSHYAITASYGADAGIPEGSALSVKRIGPGSSGYQTYLKQAARAAGLDSSDGNLQADFVDISFIYDGYEIEPLAPVSVNIRYSSPIETGDADKAEVVHFDSSSGAELASGAGINTSGDDIESVSFTADSFSVFGVIYTVDFTYDGFTFSLGGRHEILLSELMSILGIDEDVANVKGVSISLMEQRDADVLSSEFYALRRGNDWLLKSDSAFNNVYKLTIEMADGTVYIIEVTDNGTAVEESSDLRNFLTNVTITGATQNPDGSYVISDNQEYTINMTFHESAEYQFANDQYLTYTLPQGIKVLEETSGPLTINIVYKGRTYQVGGTFNLDTDGNLKVKFDQTDPDYPILVHATNVSFRFTYDAVFTGEVEEIEFSDTVIRDIVFDDPEAGEAFAEKTAVYDEETGTFHYTITVTADGQVENVRVKDDILGDALSFNHDVNVSFNGDPIPYEINSTSETNGFDYTFASMTANDVITITYSATVDFSQDLDGDGKITADQTKNTVTVTPKDVPPHNSEYSREIDFKTTYKSEGTDAGTTEDGDKILDWTITYNELALASAAGDTITDTISVASRDYMKYYGNGITVKVYNKAGQLVHTRNINYSDLTNYSVSTWTYTIPATDTGKYKYVITYQTIVDMAKVKGMGTAVTLSNTANDTGSSTTVSPSDKVTVQKDVESYSTQEVSWVSNIHVPADGLIQAVVKDTMPVRYDPAAGVTYKDRLKDGTLDITGLLEGESYTTSYDSAGNELTIVFYQNADHSTPGLLPSPGGRTVTVRMTTLVDQNWLQAGYKAGGYMENHSNTINVNGIVDTATATFGKPGITKKAKKETDEQGKVSFKYEILLCGVNSVPVSIQDKFDTELLEMDTDKGVSIYGGNQWSQIAGPAAVAYSETQTGATFTANSVPKDAQGNYYSYYRIDYYLNLKEGVDLEALAAASETGEHHLINKAIWNDHETEYDYKTVYDYLDKKLLNEGKINESNRLAEYQITFNQKKGMLNGGNPLTMTDVLSSNLSLDYSSISIQTDPAGNRVSYSISGGPDGTTVATYIIPDETSVVIKYKARVIGPGVQTIVNTASVNGKDETSVDREDYSEADEGTASVVSFKIVKVDGYDASKKLKGVKFKIFAEDQGISFDDAGTKEIILETDENGEIVLDGEDYYFYFDRCYHVQEIEPLDDYMPIGFDYLVTLTDDMSKVDYGHYIYYYSDAMQIKNWPLEGLIIEKKVESSDAADKDQTFEFRVSILKEDGTVDTEYNEKNGDDQFTNGVSDAIYLKDGQQHSMWGFTPGTRYKVEEILTDEQGQKFTAHVTYGQTTQDTNSHTGMLEEDTELIVFTNTTDEPGSLKIVKQVTVNGEATTGNLADGTYLFTVKDSEDNPAVKADGTPVGDISITITNGVSSVAEVTGLKPGTYTITEKDPTNGTSLVGANDIQVTVVAGQTGDSVAPAGIGTFTNNIDFGGLEVSKVLISKRAADANQTFTFTVTLGDTTINGTFDDMSFVNGEATFTLKGGESAKATGLPAGITYKVTEAAAEGFELTGTTGDEGTISSKKSEVVFENTRETGDLEVSKVLISNRPADADQIFTFTVELSDKTISGTFGGMTFAEGVATVKVKGNQKVTATGLPTDITYTVTEESATGFKLTETIGAAGTISTTKSTAVFTNTREKGGLKVSKTVASSTESDKQKEFNFTVTLGEAVTDGEYGDMTFTNGVATFTLKHGQTKTATGLPTGVGYTVTEADVSSDNFVTTTSGTISGNIIKDATPEALFTNTKIEGGLTVTKSVTSIIAADKDKEFGFTVTLDDKSINGTYGDMTFTNGEATFTLKHGERATASGLPIGIKYTVVETADGLFTTTSSGVTGEIKANEPAVAAFVNTRITGDLEVSKVLISKRAADANQTFTFTVTLGDTTINGTFGDMSFVNGEATFTLRGSEKKTATGLPAGIKYTVTEAAAEGFELTGTTGDEGTISSKKSEVVFENTRETGDLEVSKVLISNRPADADQIFTFTVTLGDNTISGTFGSMFFTNGVATVKVKGNQKVTATGLPTDITYTVTEESATGFKLTETIGAAGTISTTKSTAVFTNTREKGGLKVSKTVASSTESDKQKEFNFTVTLGEAVTDGEYGDMTFTNGVATFTLKHGQTKTATGLPTGVGYTVTEADVSSDNFVTTTSGTISGNIIKDATPEALFTNTKIEGGLTVTKSVTSIIAADKDKEFGFTVTLDDKSINGTYGDMTFTNGEATFTLKHGERATASGLPIGIKYTVVETADGLFTTTSSGVTGEIKANEPAVAAFVNTRITGDLEVSKVLISKRAADANQTFTFTVTLGDTTINGTFGDMSFVNGEATFTLRGSEKKTATGLPAGIKYTVTEAAAEGFELTGTTGDEGTISSTKSEVVFENTRETGDLEVSKVLISNRPADADQIFTFTVTLGDNTISGTFGSMFFTNGVATVKVKGNQKVTATGLPTDITYTVTEESATGFKLTETIGAAGTISTTKSTAVFTNTREKGGLKVSKTVASSTESDKQKEFNFTVTLGEAVTDGEYGDMTFTNGVATFTLKHGQTKTATGLPTGVGYTVTEADVSSDNFVTTTSGTISGNIIKDATPEALFTNTKIEGGLTVTKSVTSIIAADKDKEFGFTVTLDDKSINGTYGDMTFTNGEATFTLKHGERATASGLPIGIKYTVVETADGLFTTTSSGVTGEIKANEPAVAAFVNTRITGDLEVSKVLISKRAADANQTFTFTVTLGDTTINGTFGDMSFVNGEATFTLRGSEKKTATGLPAGIKYTVTEAAAEGFELTGTTGDEGTISSTKSEVVFENTRETGDLEVSKVLISNRPADADQIFTFTVTLGDNTISGTFGSMFFTNGVATVKVKGNQKVTATGLPTDITYTVTEESATGFTLTRKTGDTGTISTTKSTAVFTNTRDKGGLKVSKTVKSSTASDKQKEFNFTVALNDTGITGTFGEMTFTNGVATFTLKDGETKTASGLPTGVGYTVTETDANTGNFVTTTSGTIQGNIEKDATPEASFTNKKVEGGLAVTKSVVSAVTSDHTKRFHFKVTLDDTTVNGNYGQMTFTNGVAEFDLADGESRTAEGLARGIKYTVEETADGQFTTTYTGETSGEIKENRVSVAGFVNTRIPGDLEVSKRVISDRAADRNQSFRFTVTLGDTTINGTFGDMSFANGVATFTLRGGEKKTATGLPAGITYTVTEASASGFTLTGRTGYSGTISRTKSEAVFTNTRETGDLEVSKVLVSYKPADADQLFTFTVTLGDNTISGTYGGMFFTNGVATVKVKGGQKVTATGLPTDVTYRVTEESVPGFTITGRTGDTGTIRTTKSFAEFENERDRGGLTVSKTVESNNAADWEKEFHFTITLDDTGISGNYGVITFVNGVASFTLKDGEAITVLGLPTGTRYTVAETDANTDNFVTTTSGTITGSIIKNATPEAAFINTKVNGGLAVTKSVVSAISSDHTRRFRFRVTLGDRTVNGTFGGMTFVNGVTEFLLTDGESRIAQGLPRGIRYTVEETADGEFTTTSTGTTGEIRENTASVAAFTNTRGSGSLEVNKRVVSDRTADANQRFRFTVTLSDTSINGVYGGMEFRSGVATFYLRGGESVTATGLPSGVTYRVTEASVSGFTNTRRSGYSGTISGRRTASFTNTRDTERRRNYTPSGRRRTVRRNPDGYTIIPDNGVPLAKIPTGDEMHVSIMTAILAAAAAAVVLALLTGRKRKRVRRHSRR